MTGAMTFGTDGVETCWSAGLSAGAALSSGADTAAAAAAGAGSKVGPSAGTTGVKFCGPVAGVVAVWPGMVLGTTMPKSGFLNCSVSDVVKAFQASP